MQARQLMIVSQNISEIALMSRHKIKLITQNIFQQKNINVGHSEDIYDNEEVIYQFAECMAYFWKKRIDEVLPENKVVVEIGEKIMGEYGISITFYQKD